MAKNNNNKNGQNNQNNNQNYQNAQNKKNKNAQQKKNDFDNDLADENVQNDITAADLQDLK